MRGAWIEMLEDAGQDHNDSKSPPVRGAWIEIILIVLYKLLNMSPPVRGAWIEIGYHHEGKPGEGVASREGGVD